MAIGNDGQVDTAGRIQSDELELKLLRELIYSFQGIEGKTFWTAILFSYWIWATVFSSASDTEAMIKNVIGIPIILCFQHPFVNLGVKHFRDKVLSVTRRRIVVLLHVHSITFGLLYKS